MKEEEYNKVISDNESKNKDSLFILPYNKNNDFSNQDVNISFNRNNNKAVGNSIIENSNQYLLNTKDKDNLLSKLNVNNDKEEILTLKENHNENEPTNINKFFDVFNGNKSSNIVDKDKSINNINSVDYDNDIVKIKPFSVFKQNFIDKSTNDECITNTNNNKNNLSRDSVKSGKNDKDENISSNLKGNTNINIKTNNYIKNTGGSKSDSLNDSKNLKLNDNNRNEANDEDKNNSQMKDDNINSNMINIIKNDDISQNKENDIPVTPMNNNNNININNKIKILDDDDDDEEELAYLNQKGNLELAIEHGNAQLLYKIKNEELLNQVEFCSCCMLPQETPGIVEPYDFCVNVKEFTTVGGGIYLYYVFIKFIMWIFFISLCFCSVPQLIIVNRISNHIEDYCNNHADKVFYTNSSGLFTSYADLINDFVDSNIGNSNSSDSSGYGNNTNNSTGNSTAIKNYVIVLNCTLYLLRNNDYLNYFNTDNYSKLCYYNIIIIEKYTYMLSNMTSNITNSTNNKFDYISSSIDIIDFPLLNVCLMLIILIVISVFITLIFNLIKEADINHTTAEDFSLIISGVEEDFNNKNDRSNNLPNSYFQINGITPLEVNMVYKLKHFFKLSKLFQKLKKESNDLVNKISHKDQEQERKLREEGFIFEDIDNENNNNNTNNHDKNLHNKTLKDNLLQLKKQHIREKLTSVPCCSFVLNNVCCCCGCCGNNNNLELDSKQELAILKESLIIIKEQLKQIIIDTNNNESSQFSSVVIATFKTIQQTDDYLSLFPQSFPSKLLYKIKRFLIKLFDYNNEYSSVSQQENYNKDNFSIKKAPEPNDIIWENLEISETERFFTRILTFLISFFFVIVVFLMILSLNYAQTKIEIKDSNIQYAISTAISVIISVINFIFKKFLFALTEKEKSISMTSFHLNFSIKLSLFTFINTAVTPLVVNILTGDWNDKSILVNNVFLLFISNNIVTPFLWFFNVSYLRVRCIRRMFIREWRSLKKFIQYGNSNDNNKDKGNEVDLDDNKDNNDKEGNEIKKKSSIKNTFKTSYSEMTQGQLNNIFENPSIDISVKMAFFSQSVLMSFFYLPIFPLGMVITLLGTVIAYLIEKFNLINTYKRPEMIDFSIIQIYFNLFKISLLVYAISNYIFYTDTYPNKNFEALLIYPVLVTLGLAILPIHYFLERNYIGLEENEIIKGEYNDFYFSFPNVYDRCNPLTKIKGTLNYLDKLYSNGHILKNEYETYYQDVIRMKNSVNLMEIYYRKNKNINSKSKSKFKKDVFKKLVMKVGVNDDERNVDKSNNHPNASNSNNVNNEVSRSNFDASKNNVSNNNNINNNAKTNTNTKSYNLIKNLVTKKNAFNLNVIKNRGNASNNNSIIKNSNN